MKAIETTYKGYRFRSRLEARAAVFMDEAGIKYVYEPEGFVFEDGTTYLPDFYLPDMDMFLECKGIMSQKDEDKIDNLAKETGKEIIIIEPDLLPQIGFHVDNRNEWYPFYDEKPGLVTEFAAIGRCYKCRRIYIFPVNLGWECRCCGYYDGDGTCQWLFSGNADEADYYEPIKKAKAKRFEFGEAGA